jgi:hypothetical protein
LQLSIGKKYDAAAETLKNKGLLLATAFRHVSSRLVRPDIINSSDPAPSGAGLCFFTGRSAPGDDAANPADDLDICQKVVLHGVVRVVGDDPDPWGVGMKNTLKPFDLRSDSAVSDGIDSILKKLSLAEVHNDPVATGVIRKHRITNYRENH